MNLSKSQSIAMMSAVAELLTPQQQERTEIIVGTTDNNKSNIVPATFTNEMNYEPLYNEWGTKATQNRYKVISKNRAKNKASRKARKHQRSK